MPKCRIFIASSIRTSTLAEILRDELETDICEATLSFRRNESPDRRYPVEMLEAVAKDYDFAVIILANADFPDQGRTMHSERATIASLRPGSSLRRSHENDASS